MMSTPSSSLTSGLAVALLAVLLSFGAFASCASPADDPGRPRSEQRVEPGAEAPEGSLSPPSRATAARRARSSRALKAGCVEPQGDFQWSLPPGFPPPRVPDDNVMSEAKVALGRRLFYDKRLSGNETFSCATCHEQRLAFTDGRGRARGSTGEVHPRGSMSLVNLMWSPTYNWASVIFKSLERQALGPMFAEFPVELGLAGRDQEMLTRFRRDAEMSRLFAEAFPCDEEPVSVYAVTRSLAAFQRTLISGDAPFDRYLRDGDVTTMDPAALYGAQLFYEQRFGCASCHGGLTFAEPDDAPSPAFFNTGLYNVDGEGAYPKPNTGLHEQSRRAEHMGLFKVPTLRNIAVTAPYMHDGTVETLDEVLDHYAAGGRTLYNGRHEGVGAASPLKSDRVVGFELSAVERAAMLAFLDALTDERFLTRPELSSPQAP